MSQYDNLPYSPRKVTSNRLRLMELQNELLNKVFARELPTPQEDGDRAKAYTAGKQIGSFEASLHKITPLLSQVNRYLNFAPEPVQEDLYREAQYNLTRFPSSEVFEALAKRIQEERQAAISQGFVVPDPLDFNYPAPPGILTDPELLKVKRARANARPEE